MSINLKLRMPTRINVYCRKSISYVTAQEIRKGLEPEDWHLMGDGWMMANNENWWKLVKSGSWIEV